MNYYAQRLLQAIVTIWAVISFSFVLIRFLPGGPVEYIRAQLATEGGNVNTQHLARMVQEYTNVNPDRPIHLQYVDYMSATLQGDLGKSIYFTDPVADIVLSALPWTVFVMGIAMILGFAIGILSGAIMAYHETSKTDTTLTFVSAVLNSTPYYIAAVILLFSLGYLFNLFPTSGRVAANTTAGFNLPFIMGAIHHAVLPILSMAVTMAGGIALAMRGNSIRVLGNDYIRVAQLRGLKSNLIAIRYVGKNSVLPMYTQFMISIGFVFGGSVILEEIFSYSGIGYYMFKALQSRDHPLMMGTFLVLTIAVVAGLLIADLTYGKLDPRAGSGGEKRESF